MLPLPQTVEVRLRRWLKHHGIVDYRIDRVQGQGRSAASVWRLEVSDPQTQAWLPCLAVRDWCWSEVELERLVPILRFQQACHQRCMKRAAVEPDQGGLVLGQSKGTSFTRASAIVPAVVEWDEGQPIFVAEGTLWTLATWCRGGALPVDAPISDGLLRETMHWMAEIHSAGAGIRQQRSVSPGIRRRLACLRHWSDSRYRQQQWVRLQRAFAGTHRLESHQLDLARGIVESSLELCEKSQRWLLEQLSVWENRPLVCHWIIGDFWRENILVDQGRVSGIVDFGAARVDWGYLELVRCLGSWLAPDDPRLSEAVRAYDQRRQERSEDWKGISGSTVFLSHPDNFRQFDFLFTVTAILQWFDWLADPDMPTRLWHPRTLSRLTELYRRVQALYDFGDWAGPSR
jgi:aminoglycoside phosphotransferase (APT) family kinase protein